MPDEFGTPEMFEVPARYRPPKNPPQKPLWGPWKGKRTSCDDCIRAIAAGASAFLAEPARHIRTDTHGRAYYCDVHAMHRRERDHAEERRNQQGDGQRGR
jgi:hypothetical protein